MCCFLLICWPFNFFCFLFGWKLSYSPIKFTWPLFTSFHTSKGFPTPMAPDQRLPQLQCNWRNLKKPSLIVASHNYSSTSPDIKVFDLRPLFVSAGGRLLTCQTNNYALKLPLEPRCFPPYTPLDLQLLLWVPVSHQRRFNHLTVGLAMPTLHVLSVGFSSLLCFNRFLRTVMS